jgi:cytochrome c peroxidase
MKWPNEMANLSIGLVIERIRSLADYDTLFEEAFGRGPDVKTIGMALASYQRMLVSGDSRFDRWYFGNVPNVDSRCFGVKQAALTATQ